MSNPTHKIGKNGQVWAGAIALRKLPFEMANFYLPCKVKTHFAHSQLDSKVKMDQSEMNYERYLNTCKKMALASNPSLEKKKLLV